MRVLFLFGLAAAATLLNPLPGDQAALFRTGQLAEEDYLARVAFDVPELFA